MSAFLSAVSALLLLWLRARVVPAASFTVVAPWLSALALLFQFVGYQKILSADGPAKLIKGLTWAQGGWILLGISLPGFWPVSGALNFILLQGLLRFPLDAVLLSKDWRRPILLLAAFLALVGCLPFATFMAYFQTFIPLMSVADGVTDMHQKLFSLMGLLAALAMLSVVYQTAVLARFYWVHIFGKPGPNKMDLPAVSLASGLAACLVLGLEHRWYGAFLAAMAAKLGFSPGP
ncbi:MAG: hypothetical protein V4498_03465 [candidate division FCPU426 bacterium]